jgi:hypothetical protein
LTFATAAEYFHHRTVNATARRTTVTTRRTIRATPPEVSSGDALQRLLALALRCVPLFGALLDEATKSILDEPTRVRVMDAVSVVVAVSEGDSESGEGLLE